MRCNLELVGCSRATKLVETGRANVDSVLVDGLFATALTSRVEMF